MSAITENLIDGNLEKLKDILQQAESGGIRIEYLNIHRGVNEIEPENNCRRFETTGERTIVFVARELKNWNK